MVPRTQKTLGAPTVMTPSTFSKTSGKSTVASEKLGFLRVAWEAGYQTTLRKNGEEQTSGARKFDETNPPLPGDQVKNFLAAPTVTAMKWSFCGDFYSHQELAISCSSRARDWYWSPWIKERWKAWWLSKCWIQTKGTFQPKHNIVWWKSKQHGKNMENSVGKLKLQELKPSVANEHLPCRFQTFTTYARTWA